jgi:membrane-bound serine protease (ClpP class)
MPSRLPRPVAIKLLIPALLLAGGLLHALNGAADPDAQPVVYTAEVDGIIQPITAEFMVDAIDQADQHGAALLVFTLRTPGGLVDSTRTIVDRMLSARTPIAVFIGPAGARAASAGFIITMASDVAVMARGTHIGAAHPVSLGGPGGSTEKPDETMAKKAASDVSAWVRSLADARGRNVALAAEAVTESRAFTEREALEATPPLVDLMASDVPDLLQKLNGRKVTRFDGRTAELATANARLERLEMSRRQRFLSALAHPQVAYLLLMLGTLGLTIELWNPGSILPGVAGGVCLLLAFFAFQVLPVNTAGLLLILFGLALLVIEIKVPSFGVLGLGGVVSLVVGSLMLSNGMPGPTPGLDLILPVVLAIATVLFFLGRLAVRSQRLRATTGSAGMVDLRGQALAPLEPGRPGQILVRGEIWTATSVAPVATGGAVRVVAVNGLALDVEPAPSSIQGASS